jgi:ATP-dependent Clp protease ATP-binding subunit ClpC
MAVIAGSTVGWFNSFYRGNTVTMERINLARSWRYQASKLGLSLEKKWITASCYGAIAILMILGFFLVYERLTIGWFVASCASLPFCFVYWVKHGLHGLPSDKQNLDIAALLSSEVLGRLPVEPTPQDLALSAMQTPGGQFFAGRYGIGPNFLSQISSTQTQDTVMVWNKALEIRQELGLDQIDSSVLVSALLSTMPGVTTLLAQLQLDTGDILSGTEWYQHIQSLIKKSQQPQKTGGFARDWSFGYTPLLSHFGINISEQLATGAMLTVELETHQRVLDQMKQLLSQGNKRNVVLIGQLGVGKTAVVEAFADALLHDGSVPSTLRYNQVISLDASALISAAPGRGELEQLVNQLLLEAHKAKNIVLCFDNAQYFLEEGVGSVDLSAVLLPIFEGGVLRIILTMDDQRWLQIAQRSPSLTSALNRVMVTPPSQQETIRVLQNQLIMFEYQAKVTYMYQSLEEAYNLSERYIHEQAMPGKALKLLQSAANYSEQGFVTAQSVRQAIERTMDVKVGAAQGVDEKQTLLQLEDRIHERMINQTRAVSVVSDALRRARAGVRNQNRPIGTFLFLGPTGVGKTELAKALASVYFGGEERLVRIDMNEYVRPEDVSRLIADPATDTHSLAAQVSKQPFSVVLLDEIEKAHSNVLTTLLQVLDEGVLRDINNREISFRDAIIIATSNAGADRIREYIQAGYELDQFEEQFTNELIDSGQFRPEFLNRFDEIVVFRPLKKEELLQVVDLMLEGLNKNLASQKIVVEVTQEAKEILVDVGYDPRLGARPMRRAVQRGVENVIAKEMLAEHVHSGDTITINADQIRDALLRR